MEADHLGGDTDMVAVVTVLLEEQKRRKDTGDPRWRIPLRPDHGHELLDDVGKPKGYPAIGRLRGAAELRGVMQPSRGLRGLAALRIDPDLRLNTKPPSTSMAGLVPAMIPKRKEPGIQTIGSGRAGSQNHDDEGVSIPSGWLRRP